MSTTITVRSFSLPSAPFKPPPRPSASDAAASAKDKKKKNKEREKEEKAALKKEKKEKKEKKKDKEKKKSKDSTKKSKRSSKKIEQVEEEDAVSISRHGSTSGSSIRLLNRRKKRESMDASRHPQPLTEVVEEEEVEEEKPLAFVRFDLFRRRKSTAHAPSGAGIVPQQQQQRSGFFGGGMFFFGGNHHNNSNSTNNSSNNVSHHQQQPSAIYANNQPPPVPPIPNPLPMPMTTSGQLYMQNAGASPVPSPYSPNAMPTNLNNINSKRLSLAENARSKSGGGGVIPAQPIIPSHWPSTLTNNGQLPPGGGNISTSPSMFNPAIAGYATSGQYGADAGYGDGMGYDAQWQQQQQQQQQQHQQQQLQLQTGNIPPGRPRSVMNSTPTPSNNSSYVMDQRRISMSSLSSWDSSRMSSSTVVSSTNSGFLHPGMSPSPSPTPHAHRKSQLSQSQLAPPPRLTLNLDGVDEGGRRRRKSSVNGLLGNAGEAKSLADLKTLILEASAENGSDDGSESEDGSGTESSEGEEQEDERSRSMMPGRKKLGGSPVLSPATPTSVSPPRPRNNGQPRQRSNSQVITTSTAQEMGSLPTGKNRHSMMIRSSFDVATDLGQMDHSRRSGGPAPLFGSSAGAQNAPRRHSFSISDQYHPHQQQQQQHQQQQQLLHHQQSLAVSVNNAGYIGGNPALSANGMMSGGGFWQHVGGPPPTVDTFPMGHPMAAALDGPGVPVIAGGPPRRPKAGSFLSFNDESKQQMRGGQAASQAMQQQHPHSNMLLPPSYQQPFYQQQNLSPSLSSGSLSSNSTNSTPNSVGKDQRRPMPTPSYANPAAAAAANRRRLSQPVNGTAASGPAYASAGHLGYVGAAAGGPRTNTTNGGNLSPMTAPNNGGKRSSGYLGPPPPISPLALFPTPNSTPSGSPSYSPTLSPFPNTDRGSPTPNSQSLPFNSPLGNSNYTTQQQQPFAATHDAMAMMQYRQMMMMHMQQQQQQQQQQHQQQMLQHQQFHFEEEVAAAPRMRSFDGKRRGVMSPL
ncbi:hypothetical protein HDU97_002669 [Phlyctochytrium planicorne]|nr:hypothetical protein HDU97_002669 [Phlyctochytrium planicorne]